MDKLPFEAALRRNESLLEEWRRGRRAFLAEGTAQSKAVQEGAMVREGHGGNGVGGDWPDRWMVRALGWGWKIDGKVEGVGRACMPGKSIGCQDVLEGPSGGV